VVYLANRHIHCNIQQDANDDWASARSDRKNVVQKPAPASPYNRIVEVPTDDGSGVRRPLENNGFPCEEGFDPGKYPCKTIVDARREVPRLHSKMIQRIAIYWEEKTCAFHAWHLTQSDDIGTQDR
jgi:hypothetical protein